MVGARFNTDFAVLRLDSANGHFVDSPDSTFGQEGRGFIDFGGFDIANDLSIADDDSILPAGYTFPQNSTSDFALARLEPFGMPDSTFGNAGKVTTG